MATRATARAHLRRRLQETLPARWTDAVLNDYLNQGYQYVQGVIQLVEPLSFGHYEDSTPMVQNQRLYPLPVNCLTPIRLQRSVDAGASYADLAFSWYEDLLPDVGITTAAARSDADTAWGLEGVYIFLDPVWSQANVADGLRLTYIPALVMGADADVPEVPQSTHHMIVLFAQLAALADIAANSDDRKAVGTEAKEEVKHFLMHWNRQLPMHGEPPAIRVSLRTKLGHIYGADEKAK